MGLRAREPGREDEQQLPSCCKRQRWHLAGAEPRHAAALATANRQIDGLNEELRNMRELAATSRERRRSAAVQSDDSDDAWIISGENGAGPKRRAPEYTTLSVMSIKFD